MRHVIAGLTIFSFLTLSTGAAYAQYLPAGSYEGSCRNITMNGNQLSAQCTDPQGRWVYSSINAGACRGTIQNRNGYLHCHRAGGSGSMMMPEGSYQASCVNATMRGSTLSPAAPRRPATEFTHRST